MTFLPSRTEAKTKDQGFYFSDSSTLTKVLKPPSREIIKQAPKQLLSQWSLTLNETGTVQANSQYGFSVAATRRSLINRTIKHAATATVSRTVSLPDHDPSVEAADFSLESNYNKSSTARTCPEYAYLSIQAAKVSLGGRSKQCTAAKVPVRDSG